MDTVQNLGQVDWDDYDSLEEVLSWMATVITFDQFDDPQEEASMHVLYYITCTSVFFPLPKIRVYMMKS